MLIHGYIRLIFYGILIVLALFVIGTYIFLHLIKNYQNEKAVLSLSTCLPPGVLLPVHPKLPFTKTHPVNLYSIVCKSNSKFYL